MSREITCDVLLVLYEEKNRTALRVVSWNGGDPVLEKRRFFEKDGEMRTGKAGGLTSNDLATIRERMDEIAGVMGAWQEAEDVKEREKEAKVPKGKKAGGKKEKP